MRHQPHNDWHSAIKCLRSTRPVPSEAIVCQVQSCRHHLVKPALLVYVLPHELYGGLGIVLVNQGHVDVIHKVY